MKTIYILHETHSDLNLNDHEALDTQDKALRFFELTKESINNRHEIKQVYCDEESEYFVEVDDCQTIRLYITEHQL
jgi:hypothetical protein